MLDGRNNPRRSRGIALLATWLLACGGGSSTTAPSSQPPSRSGESTEPTEPTEPTAPDVAAYRAIPELDEPAGPEPAVGHATPAEGPAIDDGRWETLGEPPADGRVPSRADLTGRWVAITGTPQPGPVVQPPPCPGVPRGGYWLIEQRGEEVQAEYSGPTSHGSPIRGRTQAPAYTFASGTRRGPRLALEGQHRAGYTDYGPYHDSPLVSTQVPDLEPVTLLLRYDRASQHIVGTLNGEPLRLAPAHGVERTAPCPRLRQRS